MTAADSPPRAALLAEYGEVNENFRLLTDIRFKLLAFLPLLVAAGVAATNVAADGAAGAGGEARMLALFAFGLSVTIGLATYNARNDQVYVWLVQRGAEIERELGIHNGSFGHRPNAWFEVSFAGLPWPLTHARSIGSIYVTAVALWLTACLATAAELAWGAGPVPTVVYVAAAVAALCISVGGTDLVRRQRFARRKDLIEKGSEALELAGRFRTAIAADLRSSGPDYEKFVDLCVDLLGRDGTRSTRREEVERRIDFYAELGMAERTEHGLNDEAGDANERYVALLVDLPPSMFTSAPGRRF